VKFSQVVYNISSHTHTHGRFENRMLSNSQSPAKAQNPNVNEIMQIS